MKTLLAIAIILLLAVMFVRPSEFATAHKETNKIVSSIAADVKERTNDIAKEVADRTD